MNQALTHGDGAEYVKNYASQPIEMRSPDDEDDNDSDVSDMSDVE